MAVDSWRFNRNETIRSRVGNSVCAKQTSDGHIANLDGIHSASQEIADQVFASNRFFDSSDIVQVKYEMLRRVAIDGVSVHEVTAAFGFSSQTFYQAKAEFEQSGMVGLLPLKRGPKEHKVTKDVLDFIWECRENAPAVGVPELTERESKNISGSRFINRPFDERSIESRRDSIVSIQRVPPPLYRIICKSTLPHEWSGPDPTEST
jgi:hypothetical protein